MKSHLRFLESRMAAIQHRPTLFEYYAAIHMTRLHQTRFYVYQDLPDSHKRDAGFPIQDKVVDLIDETYRHIAQVKYYKPNRMICYGHLATFLATPVLVGYKHLRLSLVRTEHCKIHSDIEHMVRRKDLTDVLIRQSDFFSHLNSEGQTRHRDL